MSAAVIQLIVLAGVAIFLILRMRSVLGTRDGFEKPPASLPEKDASNRRDFEVIEGGPDTDITDHVADGTDAAKALAAMKMAEPGFNVSEFLTGAKGAYEWILMAYERGNLEEVTGFMDEDVFEAFSQGIDLRQAEGLTVEAEFVGVRETSLAGAEFDRATRIGEVTVKFIAELTSVVKNADGEIVEGDPNTIKRQKDVWTFAREMGSKDPNWRLVATGG